jgi:molybdopterin molybdotransferase
MRIAARDVIARVSLPPFPRTAMDGFAVRSEHLDGNPPYSINVIGESLAGHPFTGNVDTPGCVRIFTGAAMPSGFDAVVIQEDCESYDRLHDNSVSINVVANAGDNVRDVGHDIVSGEVIIRRGQTLTPFAIGWLAACGHTDIEVIVKPKVAIFSTGDELREPGTKLGPGQIYDANRYLMSAMLAGLPVEVFDLGTLPDDEETTQKALSAAALEADVLLTSGGVSVGDADYVTRVLQEIGELEIWRLNIKPGKPLAYGRLEDCLFFGLPGNPVSTIVTFLLIARPALMRLCGANDWETSRQPAVLEDPIRHKPGREEYQRGVVTNGEHGTTVRVTGDQSSNRLASFSDANCLIRIPKESGDLAAATEVTVLPFFGLI